MNKFNLISFFAFILLLTSCDKDDPYVDPPFAQEQTFELHLDYWNPTGTDPEVSFDAENTSEEVKIDFTQTFDGFALPPNFTNVEIENVRIINEANINYEIEEIQAYEFRESINDWKLDVEFVMNYVELEDIAVVLVLDASLSLGEDFESIKSYAISFVDQLFDEIPTTKVGVVAFSNEIDVLHPTGDKGSIINYINGIQQGQFTSLYEAINMGINIIQDIDTEGKAILTFTDGTDNNSSPSITPNYLYNKLTNDPNDIKINSFMIGLDGNGGVDKPVLRDLAVNGGVAEFPNNVNELGDVFSNFSKSISNVYNLTYLRNQQVVPESDKRKLKFELRAQPK